ncbi:MAG TPA: biotin/lipoyl-binding protein, partial [Porticoccus sp.]|nr:biotin/lipoyl-binding protein [Porticoccus sp.]
MRTIVQSISLIAMSILLLSSCASEKGVETKSDQEYYHVAALLALEPLPSYTVKRQFDGVLTAAQNSSIGFEVEGKLSHILVDIGDKVIQGQVLAILDTELLRLERQRLNAQVAETEAKRKLTELNIKRYSSLGKE